MVAWFGVWGVGCRVRFVELGFRGLGLVLGVWCLVFGVWHLGCRDWGVGFGVSPFGCGV